MKNKLENIVVYDADNNFKNTPKNLKDYLDQDGVFKYVLFRGCPNGKNGGEYQHLLRLSPLEESKETKGKLYGDTHLTIVGKLIEEFKEKRELGIDEIDFRQDEGHGLLWLIREKGEGALAVCAETGTYIEIKDGNFHFYGESTSLGKGKVYTINEQEEEITPLKLDYYHPSDSDTPEKIKILESYKKYLVNPKYIIPAYMVKQELNLQNKIYLQNLNDEKIAFNKQEIITKSSQLGEEIESMYKRNKSGNRR